MTTSKNEYSFDIKTEILQICEAFNLGSFIGLISFTPSENVENFILTKFKTSTGEYQHYFRINE
jgi:hypothetical protein